jgi:hypothetical protein
LKDWFGLEEFSTIKRMPTLKPSVDQGHLRNSRCDLFIRNPDESIAIEAKQAVQRIPLYRDRRAPALPAFVPWKIEAAVMTARQTVLKHFGSIHIGPSYRHDDSAAGNAHVVFHRIAFHVMVTLEG